LDRLSGNSGDVLPKHKIVGLTQPLKDILPMLLKSDTDIEDIN